MNHLPKLLEELERLEKEATQGEWVVQIPAMVGESFPTAKIKPLKIEGRLYSHPMIKSEDANLICLLRNNAPLLLALSKEAWRMKKTLEGYKQYEEEEYGHTDSPAHETLSSFESSISPFLSGDE